MESVRERAGAAALRAYVKGDSSEPVVLSAFRGVPPDERARLVSRHRGELREIDGARLVILESMILPLDDRRG
ncbi:MAG TPA: hypothetical protein VHH36_08815 [Candidatus Thermoplasmatota archaeon]|nr:hypothetical protein [Candidatus Thermoplasmatota archaeon]